jgi:RNA 3'-terminal phosphate cyclase (ATP)
MLMIDGARGEGGGQILRTALSLSLVTGRAFGIENIRAGRRRPGLLRQHLTAVTAAAEVGDAEVEGAQLQSTRLTFRPVTVRHGRFEFDVGTAGSASLVVQTIMPALLTAAGPSTVTVGGGTHNMAAPPFEFLARSYLPLIARLGPQLEIQLHRAGFYPRGGGRITLQLVPSRELAALDLESRGSLRRAAIEAMVAGLPLNIGRREIAEAARVLAPHDCTTKVTELPADWGPGNVVTVEVESSAVTEIFTGFGRRGVPAERVAEEAALQATRYLVSEAAVAEHLADQLLLPLALAGGGSFTTLPLSRHAVTNRQVIEEFLGASFTTTSISTECVRVEICR